MDTRERLQHIKEVGARYIAIENKSNGCYRKHAWNYLCRISLHILGLEEDAGNTWFGDEIESMLRSDCEDPDNPPISVNVLLKERLGRTATIKELYDYRMGILTSLAEKYMKELTNV